MFRKIENLIVVLVAISAIAILLHQTIPREFSIRPGDDWGALATSDRTDGGNSDANNQSTKSHFAYSYDIRAGRDNPFASLEIYPAQEDRLLDLRWMENISITAFIEGAESDNYRLLLRNCDKKYFSPGDYVSVRFNEVNLKLTNRPTTQTISLDKFIVPGWWLERMSVPPEDSAPAFDRILRIGLTTANVPREGKCRVIVDEIKFSGHWIPANLFYQILLGMWLCFGSLVALSQIVGLQRRLTQSKTQQLDLQRQAAELEEIATLDPLTQLYNRRGMRPHAADAMRDLQLSGTTFSLIMFDIDNFKILNDQHGHAFGDGILKHVAAVVSDRLAADAPLARWGGEEFIVICKGSNLESARQLAEQLRRKIEEDVKVTCSFGVCEVGAKSKFGEALELVDHCLYQAKNAGKNCVKTAASICQPNREETFDLIEDPASN